MALDHLFYFVALANINPYFLSPRPLTHFSDDQTCLLECIEGMGCLLGLLGEQVHDETQGSSQNALPRGVIVALVTRHG